MKRSIFDPQIKAQVITRLDKLKENTTPEWGIMKPNQMLRHVIEGNKITLGELQVPSRANFITKTLIRYFTLHGVVPSKERARKSKIMTFDEINVIERGIQAADFETEKANFIKDLDRVINSKTFAPRSPLIGKMSREDWGHLTFSHIHYHFTQFGV